MKRLWKACEGYSSYPRISLGALKLLVQARYVGAHTKETHAFKESREYRGRRRRHHHNAKYQFVVV
jgi:hypothetical protein